MIEVVAAGFAVGGSIAGISEIVGAFVRCEAIKHVIDRFTNRVDRPRVLCGAGGADRYTPSL